MPMPRFTEKFRLSEKVQKIDWKRVTERLRLDEKLQHSRTRKASAIGVAAATGAATLAFGLVPEQTQTAASAAPNPVGMGVQLADAPSQQQDVQRQAADADRRARTAEAAGTAAAGKAAEADKTGKAGEAGEDRKRQKEAAEEMAAAKKKFAEKAEKRADRSETRADSGSRTGAKTQYADNLDGWIREALAIMDRKGIPGTYEGIHRNIMRESSGNPKAINNWDINAQNGVPSKGLLQVIPPTFEAYHVEGTSHDIYDPVANIVAACNYAADRYGSIDNVNGPY